MGQGSHQHMVNDLRGSSVVGEGGNVIGRVYHEKNYGPKAGYIVEWALPLAPDELIEQGYNLG